MSKTPILLMSFASLALSACVGNNNTANTANPGGALTASFAPTSSVTYPTIEAANNAGAGLTGFIAGEDNTIQRAKLTSSAPFTSATLELADGSTILLGPRPMQAVITARQAFFENGTAGINLTSVGYSQGIGQVATLDSGSLNGVEGYYAFGVETPEANLPTGSNMIYDSGITILSVRNSAGELSAGSLSLNANFALGTYTATVTANPNPGNTPLSGTGRGSIIGNQVVGTIDLVGAVGTNPIPTPFAGTANMNGSFFGDGTTVAGMLAGTDTAAGGAGGTFTGYWTAVDP